MTVHIPMRLKKFLYPEPDKIMPLPLNLLKQKTSFGMGTTKAIDK